MTRILSITLLTAFCLTIFGCYSPNGHVPESLSTAAPRTFSQQDVDQSVARQLRAVDAPLELSMPAECHKLRYNHFYPIQVNSPANFANADAVILLQPGMQAGANVLTYFAEQLVFTALRENNAEVHVLTMERRNQCLIDNRGLEAAAIGQDIDIAKQYYYDLQPLNGKTFQGYTQDRDVPFLVELGLAQTLADIKTVAESVYPNPEERREKLYIGGHSMGGNLTSAFMGWDFDGNPETLADAGYNQAAGFIRLDIGITPKDASLDSFLNYGQSGFDVNRDNEANKSYRFAVHQMEIGIAPRAARLPGAPPETFMLLELVGMQAHWYPKQESTTIQQFPLGSGPNLLLRLIHSKDTLNFITNNPNIFDFRYSNEALLGTILDDDFMPITILQGSMGFLAGGAIADKTFPANDTIKNLAASVDDFLGFLITDVKQHIAADAGKDLDSLGSGPLYQWANYDEIGNRNDPEFNDTSGEKTFTKYIDEMTDIQTLARIIYQGETSFTEWYMPQRISLDLEQIRQSEVIEGLDFFHYEKARSVRLLELVGTESFVDTSIEPLAELGVAEGYNHLDILTAANDTPSHRENLVIKPTLRFVLQP
ncbi:MAG: hypothetical protein MI867_06190 [Pseudomonadales bacterium]|nr:hypothetical protein [Pseudomonadales bacterium]